MSYTVYYRIPYEGLSSQDFNSQKEMKSWLKTCGYDWDEIEIRINNPIIDIYELMREDD